MSRYALLLACYRSGQISERQWQGHLADDEVLARWVEQQATAPGHAQPTAGENLV